MATHLFTLFSLLLLAAAPGAEAAAAADRDDQVICKKVERPASRFLRRLCGTKAQWERLEEQHKALYAEMQNRPVVMIGK